MPQFGNPSLPYEAGLEGLSPPPESPPRYAAAGGYILTYVGANAPGCVSVLAQIRAGFHKIVVYPLILRDLQPK